MKTCAKLFLTLLPVFLLASASLAQKKALQDAEFAFQNKQFNSAAEFYKKALPDVKRKDAKARCVFMIAESYRLINNNKMAEMWYSKAIRVNYPDPVIHLHRAEALKNEAQYAEAIQEYKTFQLLVPSNPAGESGARSTEIAQKWKDAPSRYKVENMVQINSADYDFSPMYMGRKKDMLVFTSRREGNTGGTERDKKTGLLFTDLFSTRVDNKGKWETPRPLAAPVNTGANEGSCWINGKGDKMYFTRCEKNKNKVMRCSIMMCSKSGSESWTEPVAVNFSLDDFSRFDFRHPALSPDESIMVFQSDIESLRTDSTQLEPNCDLYISSFDKKANTWSQPRNLGPAINTGGKEGFPYIRQDGTLFYSSNGMLGMGGLDIYKAERKSKDKWEWSSPENLKSPMNSAGDDFGIVFEGMKDKGYLTSNREGGKGKDDIWSFVMPPLLFEVSGCVTDCKHGDSLEGSVVRMVGSDGSALEQKTKNGAYQFPLSPNVSYQLSVLAETAKSKSSKKYFNLDHADFIKLSTLALEESKHFNQNFCLAPMPEEIDIAFPRVEYDLDQARLREESKDSLNFLFTLLTDNPNLVIELAAHTDSRGDDKYNLKLSQARAEECYKYLVNEKKINPARIIPKGYGKRHLLVSDQVIVQMKTKEEQEAAHQKNRRTVIRVIRTDFHDAKAPAPDRMLVPKRKGSQEEYGADEGNAVEN